MTMTAHRREAKLVLPLFDNKRWSLDYAHEYAMHQLIDRFGGYTMLDVVGGWKNDAGTLYNDMSRMFMVGIRQDQDIEFLYLCANLWAITDQEAIYAINWEGHAVIIDSTNVNYYLEGGRQIGREAA